ncbi:hypothetical protein, partial [Helicobacter cinaedi]|uniref:hypothetical protein n=1 Tax=Helicobacter cinaedi TaxID=213 RepID=UPI002162BE36
RILSASAPATKGVAFVLGFFGAYSPLNLALLNLVYPSWGASFREIRCLCPHHQPFWLDTHLRFCL